MTPDARPGPPPLCPDHEPVLEANLRAISGHHRRRSNDATRRNYAEQCPQCAALQRRKP